MSVHAAGSSSGKRVRICAAELGIAAFEEPSAESGESGRVERPSSPGFAGCDRVRLPDGSYALWESGASVWYLASKNRERGLVPSDPRAEADTLAWLFFCACEIDPYYTALVVERVIKPGRGEAPDPCIVAEAEKSLAASLPRLERQLHGKDYVTGTFGLADIALGCTLELSSSAAVDLSAFPNVGRWLARLEARESWRKSAPPVGIEKESSSRLRGA
jgi:glutathione S-transferase